MTADEEKQIRHWLRRIGETNPEAVAEVLNRCRENGNARLWCLTQAATAAEVGIPAANRARQVLRGLSRRVPLPRHANDDA